MKIFEDLGPMAIGTRVRFLSESLMKDAAHIYQLYDIPMNPKWFPVFYVLSQQKNSTVTAIAEEIGHSHVSVSKILREMAKAGLLKEKPCSEDRRKNLVALSKEGQTVAKNIQQQYRDVSAAIDDLSKQTKNDLWKAIDEWEKLLKRKSLFQRVYEQKIQRGSSDVKIVPYHPKYRKAFRDLNVEWIQKYFKMEAADYAALDNPEDYILKPGGHILVALLKNKPVGVCALLKRKDKTYPYEMAKMAVSPKAQGKNIGWLLGVAVAEKARSLKSPNLYLESNTVLKPAMGLYKKLGFKKVQGPPTPYERCNIQMVLDFKEI